MVMFSRNVWLTIQVMKNKLLEAMQSDFILIATEFAQYLKVSWALPHTVKDDRMKAKR